MKKTGTDIATREMERINWMQVGSGEAQEKVVGLAAFGEDLELIGAFLELVELFESGFLFCENVFVRRFDLLKGFYCCRE
jgi:hypothetical protein